MFLKSILFLLPIALMASEVVWSAKGTNALSKQEYNQAIREYVQIKHPKEAKAWDVKVRREREKRVREIKENTVVLDGLMWQDNEAAKTVQRDWSGAKDYCSNLDLIGYRDWRLPTYNELLSIVDYKKYDPAIKNGFKNVASYYYWSSSEYVSGSSYAWYVNFSSGDASNYDKSNEIYVRCVRGRQ